MQSNDLINLTTEQQKNLTDLIIIGIYKKMYNDNIIDISQAIELINNHKGGYDYKKSSSIL